MASPNTAGQNKIKASDDQTIVLPTPVRPRISSFIEGLIMPSTPPAESSSGRNYRPYDVFINHCGEDTKHTVAKSIYNKLNAKGFKIFLDKYELEFGDFFPEVLENAIASASVHIAIFSKNYAKSPWCLAEIAFMMSLQPKVIFIPIFYHVEPTTLRWAINGKEIYADAFSDYEKKSRYTTKLQSWKSALHKASFYTGQIINIQCDEEARVINVVNRVLKELNEVRLDVAQHPVGLDEVEQDFHKNIVLQSPAGPIKIVGIWGMGGAGKTTFAKHFYNKNCSTFKRSSFLFDIREAASRGRLHEKQKKLLQDLDWKDESKNFDNIDEGKEILRNHLNSFSFSVLIILDDVDHKDQLDALLPARKSLGHGSLIIVTTRELRVLTTWNISPSDIYKIKLLNDYYAEELFCWHAFGQPSPFIEFKELAKNFTDACCGLPLSLKVLGSLLFGESSKENWQSQLNKLSRMMPEDIKSRLKISYDALDDEEKEMFLDVACFFIGWTSSSAIAVWDGSQWSGLLGWQRLVNKCLVELDIDNNMIRMHDHLRDLGREIANKQSPYRLWSKRQIIEIQPQQEAIPIRGMADAFGSDNCYLQNEKIKLNTTQGERSLAPGSLGLKILITDGDFINMECRELSRELMCFRCDRFAHKNLSSWLPLKNLIILQLLQAEKLEDLWECDDDAPLQLRQLLVSEGYNLKTITALQRLTSLQTLRIASCRELNTLPSLAEATSLKEINLSDCSKLERIEGLEGLRSLQKLRIYGCPELERIEGLEGLRSLQTLTIGSCLKLERIEGLEGLRSLQTLTIDYCPELERIEGLEGLRSLQTLRIASCRELKTLPSLAEATSLKEIDLNLK